LAATYYYGLDVSGYPGDTIMKNYKKKFNFTGFYLQPAANHTDSSWMGKRSTLVNQGWGIVPIYVGKYENSSSFANTSLATAAGISDANEAITDM
jgi:hypothetical protein